ncbi:MAG: MAPEG family protein [Marinomonas sp.]|jgi:uncharacterized membrane protein YecN with MAPEG domain
MIIGFYLCLFSLLILALSFNVVKQRRIYRVPYGDGGYKPLIWARASHFNALENIPLALLLLANLETNQAPSWFLHTLAIGLFLARIMHAKSTLKGLCRGRAIGMQITYAIVFILVIANLIILPYHKIFSF